MRFLALDSWRGIAALLVALYHLNALGHFYAVPIVRNSYLLVDFFFVLSGFIISHAYYSRLTSAGSAWSFLIRRFGRLWPLHAVMLLAFIAFPLLELAGCYVTHFCATEWPFNPAQENLSTVLSNLLLIQSLGLHDHLSWNWPSWSISTEFYTYALFAVIVVTLRRAILPIALFLAVGCAVVIMLFSPKQMDTTYDLGFLRCVLGFFMGFLIFRLYASGRFTLGKLATPLEMASIILVFGFLSLVGVSKATIASPLIFGFCIYVFAHEAGQVSAALKISPFLKLGEWSYSIYMVHAFILIVMLRLVSAAEKISSQPIRVDLGYSAKMYYFHDMYLMDFVAVLYLLTVVALARFTYGRVEEPARAFVNGAVANHHARQTPCRSE